MTNREEHNIFPAPQLTDSGQPENLQAVEPVEVQDPVAAAQKRAGELAIRANSDEKIDAFQVRKAQERAVKLVIEANASLAERR